MKEKCVVINKSTGRVVYRVPELNVRRVFYPRERKIIEVKELEQLIQRPGGLGLICNYLQVDDREVLRHLINADIAPEYWFTEANLPEWMNTCSLDSFKDALDFAPLGIKELIKKLAVSMPLNDHSKRQAIKEQLGLDVSRAVENSMPDAYEKKVTDVKPTQRRVPVEQKVEAPA